MLAWTRIRWRRLVVLLAAMLFSSAFPAAGQETNVVTIAQGSGLTTMVAGLENGGYELAGGSFQSFRHWYHTDWIDTRFEMLTQFSDGFGVLWGASTGERAEKFRIDPSVKLGMILQGQPTPSTTLSLTLSTTLAGMLKEKPCIADYGDIGGVQKVNCRLAASPLPPAETLKYLIKAVPSRFSVKLSFMGHF